jgi:hypothetical protein
MGTDFFPERYASSVLELAAAAAAGSVEAEASPDAEAEELASSRPKKSPTHSKRSKAPALAERVWMRP